MFVNGRNKQVVLKLDGNSFLLYNVYYIVFSIGMKETLWTSGNWPTRSKSGAHLLVELDSQREMTRLYIMQKVEYTVVDRVTFQSAKVFQHICSDIEMGFNNCERQEEMAPL